MPMPMVIAPAGVRIHQYVATLSPLTFADIDPPPARQSVPPVELQETNRLD